VGVILRKFGDKRRSDEPIEEESIEDKIRNYIENQHTVLWGQFFDIQGKEGKRQAQEFILDILIDLGITNEMVDP
jgi:hypothetical protein